MLCGLACGAVLAVAPGAAAERMPTDQAKALQNPVAYAPGAVKAGRNTYLRLCQYCHGADGRAQANPDFEAPSLREPDQWRYGATDCCFSQYFSETTRGFVALIRFRIAEESD